MSYENVPCASPDTERDEEPAPSLYGADTNEDTLQFPKKPTLESAPSRLAETANIEDHLIMNEEEIAQVSRLNRKEFESVGREKRDEDISHDDLRHGTEGSIAYNMQPPRVRWMNMNMRRWGEYTEKQSSENSNTAEVPNCEFNDRSERSSSVIKRGPELDCGADSRGNKLALDKEEYVSLQCNENISKEEGQIEGRNNTNSLDRSRAYYYYHNSHEDSSAKSTKATRGREEYESDTSRIPEAKDSQKPQDQRAVPQVYHMQYPNLVALSQAGAQAGGMVPQGLAGLPPHILREHLMRARYAAESRHPSQHGPDYASSRLEQQVPVASSPSDSAESSSSYGSIPRHAQPVNTGIQYIDRQGLVQQGFAVLPGIGPVQVSVDSNGMYYSAIPVGPTDASRYENYAAAQSFVGAAKQADNQAAQLQRVQQQSSGSSTAHEMTHQQLSQEKSLDVTKTYTSALHHAAASPLCEEPKLPTSPADTSNSSSPAPATTHEDSTDKKHLNTKVPKGRPKPYGSRPEIKCEQCGKIFGSSSALAKHKLTHSDERRYVCTICSKGFKRQDHLNGHMVTHRDKKPYECSYADCDKSYCDMRSLRRHLENHHTANQASGGSSNGSRTASPALPIDEKPAGNTVSAVTVVPAVGHVESASNRMVIKPGRGRPPKDRSGESGRSTPGNTTDAVSMHDQATMARSRERNSDSFSSTGSEDVVAHVPSDKLAQSKPNAASTEDSKTHTAIDMLKQAAERVQEQREKHVPVERFQQQQQQQQQHPYMVFPEGMYPQQWYAAHMYQGQDPRFGVYPYPQVFAPQVYNGQGVIMDGNMQRQQLANRLYTTAAEGEGHSDIAKQKAPAQLHGNQMMQPSPRQENPSSHKPNAEAFYRSQTNNNNNKVGSGMPTDATAIAIATAKDTGQPLYTRESYYGVHPSGTQWQQVRYDETPHPHGPADSGSSMGNVKSGYSHVRSPDSGTSSDTEEKYQRGVHFAAGVVPDGFDIPGRKSGMPHDGHKISRTDMNNFHSGNMDSGSPMEEHKVRLANDKDSVFRNPGEVVTPRRKRPKPEPLKIPPSASTAFHHNHPVSPHGKGRPVSPPYTPPPMLSPRSIFSHVNAAGNLTPRSGIPPMPMTPSRLLLSSRSCRSSIDGDDESLPFPEPKINVGPQFQATIPVVVAPKENAKHDVHKATMCWYPMEERKKGRKEEIEAFLDMACSVAVVGGSSNKEYALHILHRTRGNLKDAIRLLLTRKQVTQPGDPMHSYRYEGSVKWQARERQIFRNSFRSKGKDFWNLRKEIGDTKTVGDCIEFYYLWKANHPEAVRGRTRYVDSDSEDDYEDDTGSETSSNPSLFECDFPQCSAKFVSRQALNGHIRVHGGSFMKPSEPRKRRPPVSSLNLDDVVVVKRRKPTVPAPPAQPLVEGGPLPEFACKVCGRIFNKIKSRSAHMKTHVKRADDDDKHNMHRQ